MRSRLAVGVLGVALAAAAVVVVARVLGRDAPDHPDVVPWVAQRPVQLTERRSLAQPCRARDLRVDLGLQGGLGNLVGGVRVTKIGREPCSLIGRPDVRFEGGPARAARWEVVTARPDNILWRNPLPFREALRALRPGELAWAGLLWGNWCPPGTATTSVGDPPHTLVLVLPRSRDELRFPAVGSPRCDGGAGSTSVVAVQPFTPSTQEDPEPVEETRLRARVLPRPIRGRAGTAVSFHVALTNTSRRPYRFGRCPVYGMHVIHGGEPELPLELYILNCRPVRTLEPRSTRVFAMVLRVPTAVRPGRQVLHWFMRGGPSDLAPLVVRRPSR